MDPTNYIWLERGDSQLSNGTFFVKIDYELRPQEQIKFTLKSKETE